MAVITYVAATEKRGGGGGGAQQDVKDTSISPCMLKIPYFLTHILKYNK